MKGRGVPSGYVEGLNDARTLLADFFSILLELEQVFDELHAAVAAEWQEQRLQCRLLGEGRERALAGAADALHQDLDLLRADRAYSQDRRLAVLRPGLREQPRFVVLERRGARRLGAPSQQQRAVERVGEREPYNEDQRQWKVHRVEEVTSREHQEENRDERQVDEPVDTLGGVYDQLEIEIVVEMCTRHAGRGFLALE